MRRNSPSYPETERDAKHPGVAVLDEIRRSEELPAQVSPERAFAAVMCSFEQALSGAGAPQQLERGLPDSLRKLVTPCRAHAADEAAPLASPEAFVERVCEHLELDETQARDLSRVVFHAVHRLMSVGEVEDLAGALPEDLRALWRAGDAGGSSIQSSRQD